jgi:hypothetical protein
MKTESSPNPMRSLVLFAVVLTVGTAVRLPAEEPPSQLTQNVSREITRELESDWIDRDRRFSAGKRPFSLTHTREVTTRARALAIRLVSQADESRLSPLSLALQQLDRELTALEKTEDVSEEVRRNIYLKSCRLARKIAFCNPLLNIDKLLFLKRHDSAGVFHMCDQYYGCNAKPGGGLYVLSDPFGPQPKLTNLLEHSIVENGRLKGQKLDTGTFLSPELSFDGKTILFAYSQAKAWGKYQGKEAYEWKPEYSYHLFRCNADGSGLRQLTDGPEDDFDPCFMPGGGVLFSGSSGGGEINVRA